MTTTAKRKPHKTMHARAAASRATARKVAPAAPRYSEQYERALKEYEKGIQLIQKRNFQEAEEVFRSVLKNFEDESEICDRSRHYLSICREKLAPKASPPTSVEESFHLGVYHLNRADAAAALKEFERALELDRGNDMVHYGIASAHALAGDKGRAIASLQEAIRLNEKNRIYAQGDPDFDRIRDEHEFIQLVEPEEAGGN
jgi:tetratricopeptide (TPR) repeat protein